MKDVIMAVGVDKRSAAASTVQEILTKYGDMIHFRLGHHGEGEDNGRILLQVIGDDARIDAMQAELSALDLVKVQAMVLE